MVQIHSPRPFFSSLGPSAFLLSLLLGVFIVCAPFALSGYSDFRQLYTAAWMIRTGHASELYDYDRQSQFQRALIERPIAALPFNHLSYEGLLLAPFSLFPYWVAYLLVAACNFALAAYGLRVIAARGGLRSSAAGPIPLSIILSTVPIATALVQGQDSILLLALMAAAWSALGAGSETKAGALVALTLFKFQFSIPVALLFLAWRRWRFVTGFLLTGLGVLTVSVWITGRNGFVAYARMLTSISIGLRSTADQVQYQIYPWMMPNIRGLSYLLSPARIGLIVTVIGSIAVLLYAWRQRASFPLAVLVSMLVSYHGLIHDACILQIPIASLLSSAVSRKSKIVTNVMSASPAFLFPAGQLYCLMTFPLIWALPEVARVNDVPSKI